MTRPRRLIGALTAAALLVYGQVSQADSDTLRRGAQANLEARLAHPQLNSTLEASNPQFTFHSTTTDKTATIRAGMQMGHLLFDGKVAGPISGSQETRLADLDGLRGSTTLEAGIGWVQWSPKPNRQLQEAIKSEYRQSLGPEARREFDPESSALPPGSTFTRRYERAVELGSPVLVKLRYRYGRQKYSFVDPKSLSEGTERHENYSLSFAAGVLTPRLGLLAATYRYEAAFRAGSETLLCTPLGSTTALQCDTVRLGKPERRHSNIVQAEIRHLFNAHLGFNPRVSYDFNAELVGVELPMYFMRDPEQGLNGGVTLGWRSDDEEWLLSLFVGEALSLLQ